MLNVKWRTIKGWNYAICKGIAYGWRFHDGWYLLRCNHVLGDRETLRMRRTREGGQRYALIELERMGRVFDEEWLSVYEKSKGQKKETGQNGEESR